MYINVELSEEQQQLLANSKSNRKTWLIAGIALVLILAVAFIVFGRSYVFGGSPYATPEKTVNTYLDACEVMDSKKMMDCIYMGPQTEMERTFMEGIIDTYRETMNVGEISFSIVGRDIDVIMQTNDTAKVSVSYIIKTTAYGSTQQESASEVMDLVKIDGKWLFVGPSYETTSGG